MQIGGVVLATFYNSSNMKIYLLPVGAALIVDGSGMIDNQYYSYRVVISYIGFSMEVSGSSFMSNMSFLQ